MELQKRKSGRKAQDATKGLSSGKKKLTKLSGKILKSHTEPKHKGSSEVRRGCLLVTSTGFIQTCVWMAPGVQAKSRALER